MQETKFQFCELLKQSSIIDKLTVLSYEMNIYFVRLQLGQREGLLFSGSSPMRFYSSQHIREVFAPFKVLEAQMRHDSPYDEMIGNPDSVQYLASLPFSMQQPY